MYTRFQVDDNLLLVNAGNVLIVDPITNTWKPTVLRCVLCEWEWGLKHRVHPQETQRWEDEGGLIPPEQG